MLTVSPPEHPYVVGTLDIARRLAVSRSAVDAWRFRYEVGFPEPDWTVAGRPAWDWRKVRKWARAKGYDA